MDEDMPNNRLEYILYKHCAKIEKNYKENSINIFISKFKHR